MSNMELWSSVSKTPPSEAKPITGKAYSGTSPKPYYLVRRATEVFGPVGIGWGYTIVDEKVINGPGEEKLHVALVRVWYRWNGERGEVEHMGATPIAGTRKSGAAYMDEDAPKKSVTDALVKALSMLGFAGDIFSGRYDDSKYVEALREEEHEIASRPQHEAHAAVMIDRLVKAEDLLSEWQDIYRSGAFKALPEDLRAAVTRTKDAAKARQQPEAA